jgi:hypothetical protein
MSGFPTLEGAGGGLVVDQARLQQALAAVGAQPQPVAEWWLSTDHAAVVIAALGPGRRTGLTTRTPFIRVEADT